MARWLLASVALLMLPLAWGCGSGSATQAEGQDTATEIVDTATKLAEKQQLAVGRAWAMGQVATAWAAVDPAAARGAVADSIEAAEEAAAGGDEQRSVAADLREQSSDWAPTDWRGAIALAERIERNSSRAWVLRAIAGELADQDRDQAASLLAAALEVARSNPLPQYRATDESTVAIELARIDPDDAREVAAAIADPAARARALREMAESLQGTDPELAATVQADAISTAREISDPYDRAWALRESALALGGDGTQARELLAEAEDAAEQITDTEPQAYALSDIAIAWANLDLDKAMALAKGISTDHPEARTAAFIGIGEARISASDPEGAKSALMQALGESEEILDTYERAQAVNTIVTDLAGVDREEAVTLAEEIEDPYLKGDALRFLAVEEAAEKADDAVSLAEEIEPPFIRVQALIAVGEEVAAVDRETAVSIFTKALSEGGDLKDTYPLSLLASAWAPLDPAKAEEIANKVEDDRDRVHALTDVALAMLDTDATRAQVIFETAQETAQGIKSDDDPFAAATALQELAGAWLPVDKEAAGRLYASAFEAAAAVAVEAAG